MVGRLALQRATSRWLALLAAVLLAVVPVIGVPPASATAPPPAAPSITSVTPGDGTLTVAFTPPAGVCPPCTFVVEASPTTSHLDIVASASGTSSPLTITGLTNGTPYYVRAWVRSLEGGTVTEFVGDGVIGGDASRYRVHTFTTVGSTMLTVDRDLDVEVLVVAGGGSGGSAFGGGGGGAGGLIDGARTLAGGPHAVVVGAGGDPATAGARGVSGGDSELPTAAGALIAVGGGGGGGGGSDADKRSGLSGGSGGGSRVNTSSNPAIVGGAGTLGQGNEGGRGLSDVGSPAFADANAVGGGGGGAGGKGEDGEGFAAGPQTGRGGPGLELSITGEPRSYAAGGGGGETANRVPNLDNGGVGGGGSGAVHLSAGSPGTTPGSGGGGGATDEEAPSGAGADGIVIVRHIFNVGVHPVAVAPGVPVVAPPVVSTLSVACSPSPPVAGAPLDCIVRGAEPDFDIVWRLGVDGDASSEGVVRIGPDGSGEFTAVAPSAALGRSVSIELVAWTAPLVLGVAGGPVPAAVPAGALATSTPMFLLLALAAAGGVLLIGRRALNPRRWTAARRA